jgi:hypothetical protein
MEVQQLKHAATLTKKSNHLEREREHIFEILGLTKICLFEMVLSGAFCCMIKSKSLTSTQRS